MDNKPEFSDRLKQKYRLIFLNDETLDEIKSYRLKLWHFLGIGVLFILITTILSLSIIAFSPFKKQIASLIGIESNAIFVDLNKRILELEHEMMSHDVYKEGIENLLNGVSVPDSSRNHNSSPESTNWVQNNINLHDLNFVKPITGKISGEFDAENQHFGIDLTAPRDTPIKSMLPGRVIQASWNNETGHTICIQHGFDLISIYKHNSSLLKDIGQPVKSGESIAIIGNSGELSSGPHLHFEIWYKGNPINPNNLMLLENE